MENPIRGQIFSFLLLFVYKNILFFCPVFCEKIPVRSYLILSLKILIQIFASVQLDGFCTSSSTTFFVEI